MSMLTIFFAIAFYLEESGRLLFVSNFCYLAPVTGEKQPACTTHLSFLSLFF